MLLAGSCPAGTAYIDTPIGDLDYDNQLHTGGFSTLDPMQNPTGECGVWPIFPEIVSPFFLSLTEVLCCWRQARGSDTRRRSMVVNHITGMISR